MHTRRYQFTNRPHASASLPCPPVEANQSLPRPPLNLNPSRQSSPPEHSSCSPTPTPPPSPSNLRRQSINTTGTCTLSGTWNAHYWPLPRDSGIGNVHAHKRLRTHAGHLSDPKANRLTYVSYESCDVDLHEPSVDAQPSETRPQAHCHTLSSLLRARRLHQPYTVVIRNADK